MKNIISGNNGMEVVFSSLSEDNSHMRGHVSRFILESGKLPVNNFMVFDSDMYTFIDRKKLRAANTALLRRSDQLWIFGRISETNAGEITLFEETGRPVKYFDLKLNEIPKSKVLVSGTANNGSGMPNGERPDRPLVYAVTPKENFYYRLHINKFVLDNNAVPLNPFVMFDFFIMDSLKKDAMKTLRNSFIGKADEVWIFGDTDGLLDDIKFARKINKPIVYYDIRQVRDHI